MKTDPSVSLREGSLMVAIAVTEGSCLFVEEKRYRSLVGEGVRVYQLSESRNDKWPERYGVHRSMISWEAPSLFRHPWSKWWRQHLRMRVQVLPPCNRRTGQTRINWYALNIGNWQPVIKMSIWQKYYCILFDLVKISNERNEQLEGSDSLTWSVRRSQTKGMCTHRLPVNRSIWKAVPCDDGVLSAL